MSCSTAAPTNKLELTLDEQDVATAEQRTSPCATPKGYRAIPLEITPTTWKADLSKCNVCEVRFTWLNHRHKCRKCMEAVCDSCSKDRKALRAYTAPKRVCDRCVKNCWTPRDTATTPRKPAVVDADTDPAAKPAAGKDGRRVSLTLSASDANACPVVATATAPLSPGTPAAAGFFGPGCATTPLATPAPPAPTPVERGGAGGPTNKNNTTTPTTSTTSGGSVDTRPPSASSRRRHHRRQVSVAMPSPPPASPATTSASSSASPMTMMLPPPTPAAIDEEGEGEDEDEDDGILPPSAAASPSSSAASPPAPFFGGRPGAAAAAAARRSRRESSGGRLESRVWGGGGARGALGALGGGGDVDKALAELLQLQGGGEKEVETETEEGQQQAEAAPSAPPAAALLLALPEEPAAPATTGGAAAPAAAAAAAAAATNAVGQEEEEEEEDYGEGGPMMIKMTGCSGLAVGGVAFGTGVAVAVVLRSAFSLVFFY